MQTSLNDGKIPLGKVCDTPTSYEPALLFPIPRSINRERIGITQLPFSGWDLWNAYELSWLHPSGKPEVGIGRFLVPAESEYLIESKSLKQYLHSLNSEKFASREDLATLIQKDLSKAAQADVQVEVEPLSAELTPSNPEGFCLDDLDLSCDTYLPCPDFLKLKKDVASKVSESYYTHLLKSRCPVTGHPDWGTLWIKYEGYPIDAQGILRYVVSLRDHQEFHEQCVERAFQDILSRCAPDKLFVMAFYTRRGGLDINPLRSNYPVETPLIRMPRQ